MRTGIRDFSALDRLLSLADEGLRVILAGPAARSRAGRPSPAQSASPVELSPDERRHAAGLMRVNHAGEIAAQGLYHGQALVARTPELRQHLDEAAREEGDHLAWCESRLEQLGEKPSVLNPLWYAGSVALGAGMALAGDALSLGFIVETERQVEQHLTDHLERLPAADLASRTVLEAMRADEVRHGNDATAAGAGELPPPLKPLMRAVSRLMTFAAYRV